MIKVFTINLCTSVDVQLEVDDNETFEESKEYIEDNLSEIIAPYSEEIVTNAETGTRTLMPPCVEVKFTPSNVLKKRLNQS